MTLHRLLRGTDVNLSSQISLTTLKIKNFDISGMHAEAASLVVHQIGLIRTISMWAPCLVGANLNGLVNELMLCLLLYTSTRTPKVEDMQTWRKQMLLLSLCYNACVILLGPVTYQSWSQKQWHTQSSNTFPRQQSTTMWELAQATLHNVEKPGSWNLELFNLAGWQQPILKHLFIHEGGLRFMVLHDWEYRW